MHHCSSFDWIPYLNKHLFYHPPYPLIFPQVAIERHPVTIIVCDCLSKLLELCCHLEGVQVEPYCHLVFHESPLQCLPSLSAFLTHPERFSVIVAIIQKPWWHMSVESLKVWEWRWVIFRYKGTTPQWILLKWFHGQLLLWDIPVSPENGHWNDCILVRNLNLYKIRRCSVWLTCSQSQSIAGSTHAIFHDGNAWNRP